ncbi:MAG TPA: metallophosphoesterase, partial [Spirochaetia bacterium]
EFAQIYSDFGYGDAVSRDPASLSYVAEPVPGLWLLALDSAKYENNMKLGVPETSGAIRPATLAWADQELKEAARLGKAVIATEHHPLMEHFDGMKDKYPEYIVDDNWRIAGMLAANGVRLFLSGHFHANSVVMHRWDENAPIGLRGAYITDVETGSLVTWPCPYRTVTLSPDGRVEIRTSRVDQLPSYAAAGRSFDVDGKKLIEDGIASIGATTMKRYWVPQRDIDTLTPQIVAALMAHYAGDATAPAGAELMTHKGLSFMGGMVVSSYDTFTKGIWKTHPPADVLLMPDNNLTIDADGRW